MSLLGAGAESLDIVSDFGGFRCDRILWKSLPSCEKKLQLLEYDSTEDVTTSDHKPARALFMVQPADAVKLKPKNAVAHLVIIHPIRASLDGAQIKLSSLKDVYISVVANPADVIPDGGTAVSQPASQPTELVGTIACQWTAPFVVKLSCFNTASVNLFLTVKHTSKHTGPQQHTDVVIGTAIVNLAALHGELAACNLDLDQVPLIKNGVPVGTISLTMERHAAR